jgi:hypothetical protein
MKEETAHDLFEGLTFHLKRIGDQLEALNRTLNDVLEEIACQKDQDKCLGFDQDEKGDAQA